MSLFSKPFGNEMVCIKDKAHMSSTFDLIYSRLDLRFQVQKFTACMGHKPIREWHLMGESRYTVPDVSFEYPKNHHRKYISEASLLLFNIRLWSLYGYRWSLCIYLLNYFYFIFHWDFLLQKQFLKANCSSWKWKTMTEQTTSKKCSSLNYFFWPSPRNWHEIVFLDCLSTI